jgi:anti-sigma factor RsiW
MATPPQGEHLRESEVVAYLSDDLMPAERERVESHLAECLECRREVIEVAEILTTYRRRRTKRRLAYLGAILVLAALAALLVKAVHRIR